MFTLPQRMISAAFLDRGTYEAVESDQSTIGQAVAAVVVSSLAAGLGAAGWSGPQPRVLLSVAAIAVITWLLWSALILYIGGVVLRERQTRVTYGELLRTTGLAASPGVFQILGMFKEVTLPVFVVSWCWMLAAMVVAVRQALDFRSTWHSLLVCATTLGVIAATILSVAIWFEQPVL